MFYSSDSDIALHQLYGFVSLLNWLGFAILSLRKGIGGGIEIEGLIAELTLITGLGAILVEIFDLVGELAACTIADMALGVFMLGTDMIASAIFWKNRIYHQSPMQTEKSQPEGKQIIPETRFTEFPALSVDPRVGVSRSASETYV